jgi:hypothetical protein
MKAIPIEAKPKREIILRKYCEYSYGITQVMIDYISCVNFADNIVY